MLQATQLRAVTHGYSRSQAHAPRRPRAHTPTHPHVPTLTRVRFPFSHESTQYPGEIPPADWPRTGFCKLVYCLPPCHLSCLSCPFLALLSCMGSKVVSAWARSLGVPLSEIGSSVVRSTAGGEVRCFIDERESRDVHPDSKRENLKT